jgi:hypothetical protein
VPLIAGFVVLFGLVGVTTAGLGDVALTALVFLVVLAESFTYLSLKAAQNMERDKSDDGR